MNSCCFDYVCVHGRGCVIASDLLEVELQCCFVVFHVAVVGPSLYPFTAFMIGRFFVNMFERFVMVFAL